VLQSKVAAIDGAAAVLEACGFAREQQAWKEGDAAELVYVLPLDAPQDTLLSAEATLVARIAAERKSVADRLGELVTTERTEEAGLEEIWRLSSEMRGHKDDVKGIAVTKDGRVVTASRDKTLRVWGQDAVADGAEEFTAGNQHAFRYKLGLEGHEYHVASCTAVPPSTTYPEGLVLSGSYDWTSAGEVKVPALINVWEGATLAKSLAGHSATVSCLATSLDGKMLASGSWDKTIRIWDMQTFECKHELKGHTAAVWALLPIEGGKLLSGSADKTIRLWDMHDGKCLGQLIGHTDCVRALAMLPDGRFVSAGNDNIIKIWSLDLAGNSLDTSCGFVLGTLAGHDHFIYTLAAAPNGDIVSAGEDRTVRVWRDSQVVCTIRHPDSVWSVGVLPSGDIVSGCADGVARVFTQADERVAGEEDLKAFEAALANSTLGSHTLGGLQMEQLPGPEALEAPGASDGQTRVVREGDKALAYSWSAASGKWEAIGEVVDSNAQEKNTLGGHGPAGPPGGGPQTLNGKQYDYVFEIEVSEGRSEKLGMNKDENPYMVASNFIDDHDLNQDYLETIVSWLDNELEKLDPSRKPNADGNLDLLDKDPFNEGKVYRAGSAGNLKAQGETFYDPLTGKKLGGGSESDSDEDDDAPRKPATPRQPPAAHIPHSKYYGFPGGLAKPAPAFAKVKEFNAAVPEELRLSDAELPRVEAMMAAIGPASPPPADADLALLTDKLLRWPADKVLPALDLARACFGNAAVAAKWGQTAMGAYSMAYAQEGGATQETLAAAQGKDVALKVLLAASCAGEVKPPKTAAMMAMRALGNAFEHEQMRGVLQLHFGTFSACYADTGAAGDKAVQTAHATLLLNYAVLLAGRGQALEAAAVERALAAGAALLKGLAEESDPQAMYRLICALGTLLGADPARLTAAAALRVPALVRDRVLGLDAVRGGLGSTGNPAVQRACYQASAPIHPHPPFSSSSLRRPSSSSRAAALEQQYSRASGRGNSRGGGGGEQPPWARPRAPAARRGSAAVCVTAGALRRSCWSCLTWST